MIFTTRDVAEMFYRFVGEEPPCNLNDNDENIPEWCEMACGEIDHKECWRRFIEENRV